MKGTPTMHLRTLHPQFMGARLLWRPGLKEAELYFIEHAMRARARSGSRQTA